MRWSKGGTRHSHIAFHAVYINLLGLVLIVVVGLAVAKPLNTGSFVVTRVSRVMSGILLNAWAVPL